MSAIVCTSCGQRNRVDAPVCVRCSSPLLASYAAGREGSARAAKGGVSRFFLLPTLVLAGVLALVGFGGFQAAGLLARAMTPAQASDLAALTCTALTTQNYQLLTNAIDTTSAAASAADQYSPAALTAQLRAQDATAGPVTTCKYSQLSQVAGSASQGAIVNFGLTIQRSHQKTSTSIVLVVDQQHDGTWKISRKSNLTGTS